MTKKLNKERGLLICATYMACFPDASVDQMAAFTGRSKWTIRKWLRELRSIVREMGGTALTKLTENNFRTKIVALKLTRPLASNAAIAAKVKCSQQTVSRVLKEARDTSRQ